MTAFMTVKQGPVYTICGPAQVGNVFATYGHTLQDGRWMAVYAGEYTNGGRGPIALTGKHYATEELAITRAKEDTEARFAAK